MLETLLPVARLREEHVAESDTGDVAGGEVVEPRVRHGRPALVAVGDTTVTQPRRGIGRRILDVALNNERARTRVFEPSARPRIPLGARGDLPVGEHRGDAAWRKIVVDLGKEARHERVALRAAVAISPRFGARHAGRDHERGIGDDEIEGFAAHGFEHRALAGLDHVARGQSVVIEGDIELGERKRTFGDVGRDDVRRVAGRVKRLNAAAGAEIEGSSDFRARRDRDESRGGPADTENMLALERASRREFAEIGNDPPEDVAEIIGGLVRAKIERRGES